jgi:putative SOS response-associated peptidase YedK
MRQSSTHWHTIMGSRRTTEASRSRFSLAEERNALADRLGVPAVSLADYRPRYNIAPTQEHVIVTTEFENRKLLRAKWGLSFTPRKRGR